MARRYVGTILAAILPATTFVAGGCQSGASTANLPKPTFAGPVLLPHAAPPTPAAVAARPAYKPVAPIRAAGVPAAWVPLGTAERRQWTWIVIHHSATPTGGAVAFDKAHKAKGWDGLGYHFVIGNGTDTPDGRIEVGYRWPIQQHGAHAKTPDNQFNEHGIGICLVGNLSETRPTAKQMVSLEKLVAYLADTYHIKQGNILGHKMTGKQTECPGNNMDVRLVRSEVARQRRAVLADEPAAEPGEELIQTASR